MSRTANTADLADPSAARRHGRLAGRVALVTGGSQGIGEAIVRVFAEEGARVAFCSRTLDAGQRLEKGLRARGLPVTFIRADVSDEEEVLGLLDAVLARFGALDIVVNAAGTNAEGLVDAFPVEEFRMLLENNVVSTFLVCKHAARHLRTSGTGNVINVGSTYGLVGSSGSAAYAATKAAVISLTKTLALEWAPHGVRVNALCPGATHTQMMEGWLDSQESREAAFNSLRNAHPMARVATPDEQARAALFLASEDASFVTGHTLLVDGGYTAR